MFRIAALVAVVGTFTATQATGQENVPEPDTCQPHPLSAARAIVKEAWDREGWRQRNPVKKSQTRQLRELRPCLSTEGTFKKPSPRDKLLIYTNKMKKAFKFHRAYRSVAPYAGFSGEGYLLRWLAIPRYIVQCETNGYHGEGRWHATNGSTNGPYQFIGWPVPWPANTNEEKLAHHRMASQLGLSNWACA